MRRKTLCRGSLVMYHYFRRTINSKLTNTEKAIAIESAVANTHIATVSIAARSILTAVVIGQKTLINIYNNDVCMHILKCPILM